MSRGSNKDIEKGPIAWMVLNPVASNLIMIALLVGGLFTANKIKQEVFPDFDLDTVSVSIAYPGASPEEVEKSIIRAIEENIQGIEGIKEVNSTASEGNASITIELLEGHERMKVYQDIQQEVDRIRTFPEEIERPEVKLRSHRRDVFDIAVYGNVNERLLADQTEILRSRLLSSDQISQVDITDMRNHQITISISRDTLDRYKLTLDQVATIIRKQSVEIPGGGIRTENGELLLRMKERRDYGEQFAKIPIISLANGDVVLLEDLGRIKDGFNEDQDKITFWNGLPALNISIYRVGEETPLSISSDVYDIVDEFNAQNKTVQSVIRMDKSKTYMQRVNLLSRNGLIGLSLVLLSLGLFLEARLAFWVMMGIPISFLGGFVLLPMFGISINMISMFAFLMALGIVVDDAIVVGENVYEHRERGETFVQAAINGTKDVAVPVTFSVITNIVTFLPLMYMPGTIGKIWYTIPIVVISVFAISLFESLFILPSHLAHSEKRERLFIGKIIFNIQQKFSQLFMRAVNKIYGPILKLALKNRYIVLAVACAFMFGIIGFVNSKRIGVVPMMSVESDFASVTASLPYGAPKEKSLKIQEQLLASAKEVVAENGGDQLLVGYYSKIGGGSRTGQSGPHVTEVLVYLKDPEIRPISTEKFTSLWREKSRGIEDLESLVFESDRGGPGSGSSLSIGLTHPDNNILEQASLELSEALAAYPIVKDIDPGFSQGKRQFDFTMRPDGLALGLNSSEVAKQIRQAFYGAEALRQQRGRNEVKVLLRYPQEERATEHDLNSMLIQTSNGKRIPIKEVVEFKSGRAYTKINRLDGNRTIQIKANVTPKSKSEFILSEVLEKDFPKLQEKYPGLKQVFRGKQKDLREGVNSLKVSFLIALFGIYTLLAIPFRSYIQPLIIMLCIPFGIGGAVLAHSIMGFPLSLISFMGIIALSGVVINDSLVLIDYANKQVRKGKNAEEAILLSGIRRFRPILLTTITTFCGLGPMILETSRQARFLVPMAISLGLGIVFATVVMLVLAPAMYLIVNDLSILMKSKKKPDLSK
ncbi:efflux RND transporter permease subunit [Lentisphaera profundi]|uniref:Efflux RND transporter permease subunit n=1 Tax=Lentisphaera profundi TaxID=1658616 RepID=A0ABY7VUM1_9BACT|nr:efflux RND transporter permease subunit [Lentisphaera profundi]WDE97910.1 efflux RND transporter permease subunit [Lentisphaera profundi]